MYKQFFPAIALLLSLFATGHVAAQASGDQCSNTRSLYAALPQRVRDEVGWNGTERGGHQSRLLRLNLDDTSELEAVLAVQAPFASEVNEFDEGIEGTLAHAYFWVFRCSAGRATSLGGERQFFNLDGDPLDPTGRESGVGVVVMRPENLPGVGHSLLRLEMALPVRGRNLERYTRTFYLVHVVNGQMVIAFETDVRSYQAEVGIGEFTIHRVIAFDTLDSRPVIRFRAEHEGFVRCRTVYRFDGARFSPDDPRCVDIDVQTEGSYSDGQIGD